MKFVRVLTASILFTLTSAHAITDRGTCTYELKVIANLVQDYAVGTLPTHTNVAVSLVGSVSPGQTSGIFCRHEYLYETFDVYIQPGNHFVGRIIASADELRPTNGFALRGRGYFAIPQLPLGTYKFTTQSFLDTSPYFQAIRVLVKAPPPSVVRTKHVGPILNFMLMD